MENIKLPVLGIGDLILFSSQLIYQNRTDICFSVNMHLLQTHRANDINGYKAFVQNLMKTFFHGYNISFSENQNAPAIEHNWKIIQKAIRDERVSNHFKSIFNKNTNFDHEYYAIITKVRNLQINDFNSIKKQLFDKINNKKIKLIVLGEREVEFNPEYQVIGKSMVYSIYNDVISLVDKDLIIDMTVPKLGETTPDINSIIRDMSIIKKSKKVILFGHGGFFCTSLFMHNLIALCDKYLIEKELSTEINKQIFVTKDSFLNAI